MRKFPQIAGLSAESGLKWLTFGQFRSRHKCILPMARHTVDTWSSILV